MSEICYDSSGAFLPFTGKDLEATKARNTRRWFQASSRSNGYCAVCGIPVDLAPMQNRKACTVCMAMLSSLSASAYWIRMPEPPPEVIDLTPWESWLIDNKLGNIVCTCDPIEWAKSSLGAQDHLPDCPLYQPRHIDAEGTVS